MIGKEKNSTKYELSGVMIFHHGAVNHITVHIRGKGSSSYSAETHAILEALRLIESSPLRSFCIVTDCLSIISKIQKWRNWDTRTEISIATKLSTPLREKEISIHHAKSHSGVGINCAIDEIITHAWSKIKQNLTADIPDAQMSHEEVKGRIASRLNQDEAETRNELRTRLTQYPVEIWLL